MEASVVIDGKVEEKAGQDLLFILIAKIAMTMFSGAKRSSKQLYACRLWRLIGRLLVKQKDAAEMDGFKLVYLLKTFLT